MTIPGESQVFKCPHCGNETVNELQSFTKVDELLELVESRGHGVDRFPVESYFFITKCKTCEQASVFISSDIDEFPENVKNAFQIWPTNKYLDEGVPKAVQESYEEAKRVKKVSPLAFSLLIRRALEQLCNDKNATGDNLKAKIKDLGTKKVNS